MTEFPKNCTKEDLSVCPKCNGSLFMICDGNRLFCHSCKNEVRNNDNFQGGKYLIKSYEVCPKHHRQLNSDGSCRDCQ